MDALKVVCLIHSNVAVWLHHWHLGPKHTESTLNAWTKSNWLEPASLFQPCLDFCASNEGPAAAIERETQTITAEVQCTAAPCRDTLLWKCWSVMTNFYWSFLTKFCRSFGILTILNTYPSCIIPEVNVTIICRVCGGRRRGDKKTLL